MVHALRRGCSAVLAIGLVPVAAAAMAQPATAKVKPADTVFRNGYVYTVDAKETVAKAVAVRAGKIVYVGNDHAATRSRPSARSACPTATATRAW